MGFMPLARMPRPALGLLSVLLLAMAAACAWLAAAEGWIGPLLRRANGIISPGGAAKPGGGPLTDENICWLLWIALTLLLPPATEPC